MGPEAATVFPAPLTSSATTSRTSVVTRVMDVLGAFTDGSPLRAVEVARRCGLPPATTHRVLQELVAHGAVSRESDGRYGVGPRLWEIGRLSSPLYRLWVAAEPHLRALTGVTGGHSYLTVLMSGEGLRLQATTGASRLGAPCWVLERVPLHATAAGHVLLATAGMDTTGRVVRAPLRRFTEHTIVRRAPLDQLWEDVRRNGVAISANEHRLGETSLAAPVLRSAAGVPAAVEVVLCGDRAARRALPAVMHAAHELSGVLAGATAGHRTSRTGHAAHPVERPEPQS